MYIRNGEGQEYPLYCFEVVHGMQNNDSGSQLESERNTYWMHGDATVLSAKEKWKACEFSCQYFFISEPCLEWIIEAVRGASLFSWLLSDHIYCLQTCRMAAPHLPTICGEFLG